MGQSFLTITFQNANAVPSILKSMNSSIIAINVTKKARELLHCSKLICVEHVLSLRQASLIVQIVLEFTMEGSVRWRNQFQATISNGFVKVVKLKKVALPVSKMTSKVHTNHSGNATSVKSKSASNAA